jgi:hypothetical protein
MHNNNHVNFGIISLGRNGETFEPLKLEGTEIPAYITEIVEAAVATGSAAPMNIDTIGATGYLDSVPLEALPEGKAFGFGYDRAGRPFLAVRVLTEVWGGQDDEGNDITTLQEGVWVMHQRYRQREDVWVGASRRHGAGAWPFVEGGDEGVEKVMAAIRGETVQLGYGRKWSIKY